MRNTVIVLLFLLIATAPAWAQDKKAVPTHVPEGTSKTFRANQEWNYAQAYRTGNLLYISGTVAAGPMDKAMDQVYKTLQATLKQYNLDFTHVVKENLYTTNMDETAKHKDVRKKYYGTHTPAATWVQIVRLLEPNTVLEVELIVEIKKTE
ncbi:RidA family protein [Nibribacter koreensis]|uniref:Enamine deaminase RidA, house cleaning of reactive enamine intermediates, YjgF/YER057c/UK114 family n=1 Tax=Nibribacter koreensis TaxID=1084519 RepID=A0ABP8FI13_9BACT